MTSLLYRKMCVPTFWLIMFGQCTDSSRFLDRYCFKFSLWFPLFLRHTKTMISGRTVQGAFCGGQFTCVSADNPQSRSDNGRVIRPSYSLVFKKRFCINRHLSSRRKGWECLLAYLHFPPIRLSQSLLMRTSQLRNWENIPIPSDPCQMHTRESDNAVPALSPPSNVKLAAFLFAKKRAVRNGKQRHPLKPFSFCHFQTFF